MTGSPGGGLVPMSAVQAELMAMIALAARVAEQQQADSAKSVTRYLHDPAAFARECIDWDRVPKSADDNRGDGADGVAPYQADILTLLDQKKRVAVRAPRGTGKSFVGAIAVLWFALTRDAAGIDWKIATTAASWDQLRNYFWPEVHKWANYIRWDIVRGGKVPRGSDELMRHQLRLRHGHAFAAAPSDSAKIEGAHASSILILFDEAKGIPAPTWDAIEGALNGRGEALALALSTPGDPQGRFYEIHKRKKGLEDWTARHVTLEEAIAAGQISRKWADQRIRQYGKMSQFVQCHVLGNFHAAAEDCVIPLAWVEAAIERWYAWEAAGKPELPGPHGAGVDVARFGEDMTVIAVRIGPVITELRRYAKQDTMATAGRVKGLLDTDATMTAVIDTDGLGSGVYDRLREQGCRCEPFTAQRSAGNRRDKTGEYRFADWKSYAWYRMREALDPKDDPQVCLPDDDMLTGDLTTPKYRIESGARIRVEGKAELRKRLGRSPDDGDAVIDAWTLEGAGWLETYASLGVARCEACSRGYAARLAACPHCGEAAAA